MALTITITISWNAMSCKMYIFTNVSRKHSASIRADWLAHPEYAGSTFPLNTSQSLPYYMALFPRRF